jgi:hypothetical protein
MNDHLVANMHPYFCLWYSAQVAHFAQQEIQNQGWVVQNSVSTILALSQLELTEGFDTEIN